MLRILREKLKIFSRVLLNLEQKPAKLSNIQNKDFREATFAAKSGTSVLFKTRFDQDLL